MTQPRILVIDGFAGPGTYVGGERGSPLLILQELLKHPKLSNFSEVIVALAEEKSARVKALEQAISESFPEAATMTNVNVLVHQGTFGDLIEKVRTFLEDEGSQLAPSFVMIDPFGVKGVAYNDVSWLLSQPKCEIYLSFMGSFVARFHEADEFEGPLDTFFGDSSWRSLRAIRDWEQRRLAFLAHVDERLREAGAQHVVRFDLWNGNSYKYSIYFAGKHPLGCDRMKAAIWAAMPNGSYSYVGAQGDQLTIGFHDLTLDALDRELVALLDRTRWTPVQTLTQALMGDSTKFHSGQLKAGLKRLEVAGAIEIDPTTRNKRNTYPDGTMLRLTDQAPASSVGNSE